MAARKCKAPVADARLPCACGDGVSRPRAVDVLGKQATYFIKEEDHAKLGALCAAAVAHVTSKGPVRLRHRTTARGVYVAMDCKASFDSEFIYLVCVRWHEDEGLR